MGGSDHAIDAAEGRNFLMHARIAVCSLVQLLRAFAQSIIQQLGEATPCPLRWCCPAGPSQV
jgi:hypothetical protein